jgi:hypothetical protein
MESKFYIDLVEPFKNYNNYSVFCISRILDAFKCIFTSVDMKFSLRNKDKDNWV